MFAKTNDFMTPQGVEDRLDEGLLSAPPPSAAGARDAASEGTRRPAARCKRCCTGCTTGDLVRVGFLLAIAAFGLFAFTIPSLRNNTLDFLDWARAHVAEGALAYGAFFTVGVVICFPEIMLAAAAGYTFPFYAAFLATWIGGSIGSVAAFLLGRSGLQSTVQSMCLKNEKHGDFLVNLDRVIAERGWRLVLIVRLPYIPFVYVNYLLATSKLAFKDYLWPTVVGIIPGSLLFTWIGRTIRNLKAVLDGKESLGAGAVAATCVGLVVSLLAFGYAAVIARRAVREEQRGEEEEDDDKAEEGEREGSYGALLTMA